MDTLGNLLAYASIGLVALSAWFVVHSVGRDRPIRQRGLLLTVLLAVVALIGYNWFIPGSPTGWAWVLGALGLVGGVGVSRTTRLGVRGGEVVGRSSPWVVIQWAALFAVAQLTALGVLAGPAAGVGALSLATGVVVGNSAMLVWRRRELLRRHAAGLRACLHCGGPLGTTARRCDECGWQVRVRPRATWAPPGAGG